MYSHGLKLCVRCCPNVSEHFCLVCHPGSWICETQRHTYHLTGEILICHSNELFAPHLMLNDASCDAFF